VVKGAAGGRKGIRSLSIAIHENDEDSVDGTERLRTLLANGSTSLVVNGVVAVAATIDDATRRRAPPSVYVVPCSAAVSVVRSVARSSVDRGTPRAKVRDALCPFPMCRLSFGIVSRNAARPLSSPRSPACLRRASPTSSGRRGLASIRPRARRLAATAP